MGTKAVIISLLALTVFGFCKMEKKLGEKKSYHQQNKNEIGAFQRNPAKVKLNDIRNVNNQLHFYTIKKWAKTKPFFTTFIHYMHKVFLYHIFSILVENECAMKVFFIYITQLSIIMLVSKKESIVQLFLPHNICTFQKKMSFLELFFMKYIGFIFHL